MTANSDEADPYLWLEQVDGAEALAWARTQTAATLAQLKDARSDADRAAIHAILTTPDKMPYVSLRGDRVYNFWTDAAHERGLWRRTTLASYLSANTDWEIVLDVDALNRAEGANWVWRGCQALPHDFERGLVHLSAGGADACVVREFDLKSKRFIEGGFALPEAKSNAAWQDRDTVLVSTNRAPATTTTSGYPRQLRRWRRGEPFERSEVLFEGEQSDMGVWFSRDHEKGFERTVVSRAIDFFHREVMLAGADGKLVRLDIPLDAVSDLAGDRLIMRLRTDWQPGAELFPAGAVIVGSLATFQAGARDFHVLFRPSPRTSCDAFHATRSHIVLTLLDNVTSRIETASPAGTGWQQRPLDGFPPNVTLSVMSYEAEGLARTDCFFAIANGFLTPASLYLCDGDGEPRLLKQAPAQFDAGGLEVTQHEAASSDGELIPYFQVSRTRLPLDGSSPALLEAYGGFGLSMQPSYQAATGKAWLEHGGVLAVANLRGGGEFGPSWHDAGRRAGKKLSHDDFAAVAQDLIRRGVTSPKKLAARGGSNGGLLVGNMLTRFPDLFGAIVCAVPLLDMRRYTKLPPGASWIAEYGDPDKPEDWAFMQAFSAYQHLGSAAPYPPLLLTTSTRDDRVHPGHARKMAARMLELGHAPLFYESEDGGHAGAADSAAIAFRLSLVFSFLRRALGLAGTS